MDEYVLRTDKLCKRYGNAVVLDQVSLSVPAGSIYGLIGENGAGKTTLFRILAGLSYQNSGSFSILGGDSEKEIVKARQETGFMIEMPALYPYVTVEENLSLRQLQCFGKIDRDRTLSLLNLVGLEGQEKKKAKNLSLGMKQRLALAIALAPEPKLLILDEPINGLDPMGIKAFRNLLLKLNQEHHITIVLSSHILSELEHLATHYGFLRKGKLLTEITAAEVAGTGESLEQFYDGLLEGSL